MQDLTGKKLLIMGGVDQMVNVVLRAKEMGAEVYVTDYLEDSPAKKVADKSFMVSATDIDAMVDLCKKEKVDGLLTGYVDMLLPYYAQICEKAGLPCYGTYEQFVIMTDKRKFKDACVKYSVPVTPEYSDQDIKNDRVKYPVFVKPVDSSGSRGTSICNNREELIKGIEYALQFSKSKTYLVEKFFDVEKDADAINFFYVVVNGVAKPLFIFDALTIYGGGEYDGLDEAIVSGKIKPGSMAVAPSRFTKLFMEKMDNSIQNLITGLGIKNGPIFFQGMVEDNEFYLFECGYRIGGAIEYYFSKSLYNVSTVDMLINFALTGDIANNCDVDAITPLFDDTIIQTCMYGKDGEIAAIEGVEDLLNNIPEVIHVHYAKKVGDCLKNSFGTYQQVVLIFFLRASSLKKLCNAIDYIYDNVKILDANGGNMVFKSINGHLCERYFKENRSYPMKYTD